MADLNPQTPTIAGITPVYNNATPAGDTVPATERVNLILKNTHATNDRTITIAVPDNTWNGLATPDTAITIPALQERHVKSHPLYAQPATGRANLTYSDSGANIQVGVFSN